MDEKYNDNEAVSNNNELKTNDSENNEVIQDNGPRPTSENIERKIIIRPNSTKKRRNMIMIAVIILLLLGSVNSASLFSFLIADESVSVEDNVLECSQLLLKAKNGSIKAEGYDGKELLINVNYKPRFFFEKDDVDFKIISNGEVAFLEYKSRDVSSISIEAKIPKDKFHTINLESTNGMIEIENLNNEDINIETSNGGIIVNEWVGEKLSVDTSNGRVNLEDVLGDKIEVKTSNGKIITNNAEGKKTILKTSNGNIKFQLGAFTKLNQYDLEFDTSNGSVKLEFPSSDDIGYKVYGKTSNASINHDFDDFIAEKNSNKYLKGETSNYDYSKIKVDIEMKTTNGSITVDS